MTTNMSKKPLAIVILAAGQGTRMKSARPKVMHELAGKPMINWLIQTCEQLSPEKIITVVGPDMADLEAAVKPHSHVVQPKPEGTADAVKRALPLLKDFDGQVLILMGDEPLVPLEALQEMLTHDLSALAFDTLTPHGMGRVLLNDDGTLQKIVEEKECSEEQKHITLCNAGNYVVPGAKLAGWIEKISNDNAAGEYYLTDLPVIAAQDGAQTYVVEFGWEGPWGVNTQSQLAAHEYMIQEFLRETAMVSGVIMQDPATVYLWHDTQIAPGVLIEPNVYFGPGVTVAEGTHIKAFSHIEDAKIGKNTTVGPFARLRPGTDIGEDVRIGNFVEIKKSKIGNRSKISHLGYVGDTVMGEDVNFSCGAITVNYDGFQKHQTTIGKNVMVGSNVNLVAPIEIDDGAFIAAGSTITEDVPEDALSIAREPSEIREGWAAKYRKLKASAKRKKAS